MTAPLVFSDGQRCSSSDQWITIDSDYKKYVNLTSTMKMTLSNNFDPVYDMGVMWGCTSTIYNFDGSTWYNCIFTRGQTIDGGNGSITITIEGGKTEPKFDQTTNFPEDLTTNQLELIMCTFTLIKLGSVVTSTFNGEFCDGWSVPKDEIKFKSNSFKASLNYYSEEHSQWEIVAGLVSLKDNLQQYKTGAWFRSNAKSSKAENLTLINQNISPFYDMKNEWAFDPEELEDDSGHITFEIAAIALPILAIFAF